MQWIALQSVSVYISEERESVLTVSNHEYFASPIVNVSNF